MRVLMISGLHIWSLGAEKGASSFYNTIKGYTNRGIQVDLIISNSYEGIEDPNLRVFYFDVPWLKKLCLIRKVGFFFYILWWLLFQSVAIIWGFNLARKSPPDVVYGYEILGVPAATLLGRLLNRPVVSRFQGTVMWPLMKLKFWKLRFWNHFVALKCPTDLVIMANDGTQGDKVLQFLKVDPMRVRFWMNGVSQPFLNPMDSTLANCKREELGLDSSAPILVTVSRLVRWKRLDRIICAMPSIIKSIPSLRLVIVGDGDARQDYETLTRNLGLQQYVIFTGSVSQAEVRRYIALASLFISLYDLSNLGNPLIEAMMMGKCIVTLNNGDTGTVIKNEVNGILLEAEELTSLPEIIIRLIQDNTKRTKLGDEAKRYALGHFWDWNERMEAEVTEVQKVCSLYSSKRD